MKVKVRCVLEKYIYILKLGTSCEKAQLQGLCLGIEFVGYIWQLKVNINLSLSLNGL